VDTSVIFVWLPGGHFEIGPDVIKAAGDWLKAKL